MSVNFWPKIFVIYSILGTEFQNNQVYALNCFMSKSIEYNSVGKINVVEFSQSIFLDFNRNKKTNF